MREGFHGTEEENLVSDQESVPGSDYDAVYTTFSDEQLGFEREPDQIVINSPDDVEAIKKKWGIDLTELAGERALES